MNRTNFYFRQIVTEAELDLAFDQVEQAVQDAATDADQVGIIAGGDLVEHAPPNLTVEVDAPLIATDQVGNRIYAASIDAVDISVDSNLVSTDVSGPGREKWVSVFIGYDVVLSDERIDGNSNSVYWLETASFEIIVVQGAEDDVGFAVPTPLLPDALLLGDVRRYDGQTQVLVADISLARQQIAYLLSSANYDVLAGTSKEAMQAILDVVSDHVDAGTVGAHLTENIAFDPTGTNYDVGDVNVDLALRNAVTLVAPYPGNLLLGPDRRRTHGTNGDWRDTSFVQEFTIAGSVVIPGGGGSANLKIGGSSPTDGEDGFIEFEDEVVYLLTVQASAVTNLANGNPNWTYRTLAYTGYAQRIGGSILLLANPAVNQEGGGANLTTLVYSDAANTLYLRATGAVALAGITIRMAASIRVQRILYP